MSNIHESGIGCCCCIEGTAGASLELEVGMSLNTTGGVEERARFSCPRPLPICGDTARVRRVGEGIYAFFNELPTSGFADLWDGLLTRWWVFVMFARARLGWELTKGLSVKMKRDLDG